MRLDLIIINKGIEVSHRTISSWNSLWKKAVVIRLKPKISSFVTAIRSKNPSWWRRSSAFTSAHCRKSGSAPVLVKAATPAIARSRTTLKRRIKPLHRLCPFARLSSSRCRPFLSARAAAPASLHAPPTRAGCLPTALLCHCRLHHGRA